MKKENNNISILKENIKLYSHQEYYIKNIIEKIKQTNIYNYFISLPQGAGKTLLSLAIFSKLLNKGSVHTTLVLAPRKILVDQWVEEAQKMFVGLKILKDPTISKSNVGKTRTILKRTSASALAMTIHSFKNYKTKGYLREEDFDLVIIDEASDSALAKDFLDKFRMSYYLEGLEKWKTLKLLVFPKEVDEEKLRAMIDKFDRFRSMLIQEEPESIEKLEYIIKDPILIDDPLVDKFTRILDKEYRALRSNVLKMLKKHGIKGYTENLETLLRYKTIRRVKKLYHVNNKNLKAIQTTIIKYILIKHLRKWILYSNRKEIQRTIFSSQYEVKEWLSYKDKKLLKLSEIIQNILEEQKKVYIYSEYISTANMLSDYLSDKLNLDHNKIKVITGLTDDQYLELEKFKDSGKVLISTPVFDKGTDIPEVDIAIIFTPPRNIEKIHQIKGRIRGGEVIMLAYRGYEQEIITQIINQLRE